MTTLATPGKPPPAPKPPKPPKPPVFVPPKAPRSSIRKLAATIPGFQAAAPKAPTVVAGVKTTPPAAPPKLQMPPSGPTPQPQIPQPKPQQQPNFLNDALKGMVPWKTVMRGGLPMVAGLAGLLRGQNTLAPLFEGRDAAAKTAAYRFGQKIGSAS
jgi:hypothetical protein